MNYVPTIIFFSQPGRKELRPYINFVFSQPGRKELRSYDKIIL